MAAYPVVQACDCGTWDHRHESHCDGTQRDWDDDSDHNHDIHADQEFDL